jgi:hypothetical protein
LCEIELQVHVRHWLCREAWFVACTCGVAVREGNVVLSVDMCGGKHKETPRPKVTEWSEGEVKGASVTRDVSGSVFSVSTTMNETSIRGKLFTVRR